MALAFFGLGSFMIGILDREEPIIFAIMIILVMLSIFFIIMSFYYLFMGIFGRKKFIKVGL